MKKKLLILFVCATQYIATNALQITEIFSNPTGDDGGREWVEVYNDTDSQIELSSLSFSVKAGVPVVATPVSGGTTLLPGAYAIIGSTVSGATKFNLEYPSYSGLLFKSSISLVNTGVTSLDVRVGGVVFDTIVSYVAAKEGYSYSKQGSSFIVVLPSPGKETSTDVTSSSSTLIEGTSTPVVGSQTTVPQMSPPSADIILYLPSERVVIAGAPTTFSISALTQAGKQIDNTKFTWSFGDGGQGTGSTTIYRYFYPGRYMAFVDASNGLVAGKARMLVKVVTPELELSEIKSSKHGLYIEVHNPNQYELDISTWKLSIDGSQYVIPLNTILLPGTTTISGVSLGFASSSISTSSVTRLLFPNNEEVVKVFQRNVSERASSALVTAILAPSSLVGTSLANKVIPTTKKITKVSKGNSTAVVVKTSPVIMTSTSSVKKDRRVADFFHALLK